MSYFLVRVTTQQTWRVKANAADKAEDAAREKTGELVDSSSAYRASVDRTQADKDAEPKSRAQRPEFPKPGPEPTGPGKTP